jgi:hypothetical protein
MAESDSAINLQDVEDIMPNLVATITPSSSANLSDAKAPLSAVAGPASCFSYDFQINYNQPLEQRIGRQLTPLYIITKVLAINSLFSLA